MLVFDLKFMLQRYDFFRKYANNFYKFAQTFY